MSAEMAVEVGDRVDLKSAIGVIPEGRHEVISVVGPKVVILEIQTRKRRIVSIDDLVGFRKPVRKIDWP